MKKAFSGLGVLLAVSLVGCGGGKSAQLSLEAALAARNSGNYAEAAPAFKKLSDMKDPLGMLYYAQLLKAGAGVQKDEQQAENLMRAAFPGIEELAQKGNALAQYNLGQMYAAGEGVEKDDAEAGKWTKNAAMQGNPDAAYTLAAVLYGQRNYTGALNFLKNAAEKGHMLAQVNLAQMYYMGEGVARNPAEAFKWCTKAAAQGSPVAQSRLGSMYYYGDGVSRSYPLSAEWFLKAADQGDMIAQRGLGLMYYSGQGVKQDYAQSAKWCRAAAEQGDAEAQRGLGTMYYLGQGLAKDSREAYKWLFLAEKNGLVKGSILATVGKDLKPAEIAAAKAAAAEQLGKTRR